MANALTDFSLIEAREFVRIALEALGRYKLRTGLSVLGIVLGVAAVIAMLSVSEGARREALAQVEALGLDNVVVRSRVGGMQSLAAANLTAADASRLAALIPLVDASTPLVERYLRVSRGARTAEGRVVGVTSSMATILRLTLERGRFLAAADERGFARVAVLGSAVAGALFDGRDPAGASIRLGADYYRVVGVIRGDGSEVQPGSVTWRDVDETIFVPLQALSGRALETTPGQPVDEIWLRLTDGDQALEAGRLVEHTLNRSRATDFDVIVPRELLVQRVRTQRTFSVVIGSVAVLALLVGGIGIMNIMMTSVVERTQEIGLRRTVGARRHHVAMQFLVEALLMTVGGGICGIVLGSAVAVAITAFAGWRTTVSPFAVGVAFVVSMVVGLVFGIYPAISASRLQPVDAVRYE